MNVANEDVVRYIRTHQQPANYKIACRIGDDLISNTDTLNSTELKQFVFSKLDALTQHFDFGTSFAQPVAILYQEYISEELMVYLHQWLRTKCADIENITVVLSQSLGMKNWWKEWCNIYHEKSFSIVELSWAYCESAYRTCFSPGEFVSHPDIVTEKNKMMQYHFSYWAGGTKHYNDRSYIAMRVLEFLDHCLFDSLYKLPPKQVLLDYAEQITYFKSQDTIDLISSLYDTKVNSDGEVKIKNINNNTAIKKRVQQFCFVDSFTWNNNRCCFASVIRETKNNDLHQAFTEKTMRAFWHHLVAIPLCYNAVSNLEAQGFWFPHDLIDYRYQGVRDFHDRVSMAIQSIKKLIADHSINDLKNYYNNHTEHFYYNAKLIKDLGDDSQRLHQKYL